MLTYGSETWVLSSDVINRLNVFERKVLRRITGAVKIDDNWRRQYNKELFDLFNDIDIVTFMKIRRLSWLGHVNRMSSDRNVKQIFLNHPQGFRPRGRPKNRWWDCVHRDLLRC